MGLFNKKELARINELEIELQNLKKYQEELGISEYTNYALEIENKKSIMNNELNKLTTSIEKLTAKKNELEQKVNTLNSQYDVLNTDLEYMDFGLYKPHYDCMNSDEYNELIVKIRNKQKEAIKNKQALNFSDNWTLDGSKAKGKALNNDNMKMVLKAFNFECDTLISKVKYNNIEKIENQIRKSASSINKLNERNKITIKYSYINLKLDELHAYYEYLCKKQEEKEAIKAAREEERELAKLEKEIQEARQKIAKDIKHFEQAKEKLQIKLENAKNPDEAKEIEQKISELNENIDKLNSNLKDIDYREANQKAGYVYVISNIGAFGKDVYKIGMTRRLDPQDRIDELSDASVPFNFDVHAMIFSDDAPKLEAALHNAFKDKRVNLVNQRKEFFNVSLDEIEFVVKNNHDKLVEFKKIPDAEQYQESIKMKSSK